MILPVKLGVICEPDQERFERLWRAMGWCFWQIYKDNNDWGKKYRIVARLEEVNPPENNNAPSIS